MFYGSHVHVLDDKGRTSLPKDFRNILAGFQGQPWITAHQHCAVILIPDVFADWQSQLTGDQVRMDPVVERIRRLILGMAHPCAVDKQGRIMIPPSLRAHAGIARDIYFVGVGEQIEVWDRERYEVSLANARDSFDADRSEVQNRDRD